ncbi:unnamed protein product [Rotaria sp. Silwood2]|nr:unnamed protein product [Rotaria sp. Silwood2]CAF4236391.1 unnamed protein product [Rotaria sp. Silwood2]
MGCKCCKCCKTQRYKSDQVSDSDTRYYDDSIKSQHETKEEIQLDNGIQNEKSTKVDDFIHIEVADPAAFNDPFIQQRQQAINNNSYRSTIELWQPNSLQQLTQFIKDISKGKSIVDRHWIIFYWITFNIEYDAVSYFAKDYKDQTAEGVFQTRKGVCAGYANLYKYLCNQLEIPCEIVSGYSKGYGFDDREGAPTETDHAWNAVEIYHHWYLMESTWGAGHLDDAKEFKRELSSYYFLPRPNEMIYHHLPEDEKWQLLQTPIKMTQYLQMPHLRPEYFEYKLEMIQPRYQCFINLEQDEPFALVIMKAPVDVCLTGDLKLHDEKVEGGQQVIFDKRKRLYNCYFAPSNIGSHKITIYAKRDNTDVNIFRSVLDLTLDIKQMPKNRISYPKTWSIFFDYGLKIVSPLKTHLINLKNSEKYAEILIRTPSDIELMGTLMDHNEEKIPYANEVYYDREKECWRCRFAPNKSGIFNVLILAKKKSDPKSFSSAVSFKINANQISSPSLTFPTTWQTFYDLGLKILSPIDQGIIVLRNKTPCTEILIQTPNDIGLRSQLQNDKNEKISDGSQISYDNEKNYWRCIFAPNRKGIFDALILAKKKSDSGSYISVVSFQIDVKRHSFQRKSLPKTTQLFHDLNLKLLPPNDCYKIILSEQSSFVDICLETPNDVKLIGQLENSNEEEIPNADQVYYNRHKNIWYCKFAPNNKDVFSAMIMAKKKSSSDTRYSLVVTFQIEVNHIPTRPVTFPKTWELFHDFDLTIEAPRNCSTAKWIETLSYAEILIRAPDDIQMSCSIEYQNRPIENGALAQYDYEKKLWQLLFAPEQTGRHELIIFAKRIDHTAKSANSVAMFSLNVTKLRQPMKFPMTYAQFQTTKCQIYTPLNGILKKDSIVPIHCYIPGAKSVILTIDSRTLRSEGYVDQILQREITAGSGEVVIHAKYEQNPHYISLIKYFVE